MPAPTEGVVQDAVLRYLAVLERQGVVACVRRVNVGPMYTRAGGWAGWSVRDVDGKPYRGHPDVVAIVCGTGRALWIEVKAPGGRLSEVQRARLEQASEAGALCVVATSIDDVREALGL
jgi:hypothetical protein